MKKFHELSTPCLVLDLDRFESNLQAMQRSAHDLHVNLRPHAKTHKCVEIARRQLQQGAIGICVATIAEAEVMVESGIRGVLITTELTGQPKVLRLMRVVQTTPDTMIVVDDAGNVEELERAAGKDGLHLRVLIDLDVGQNRTGVAPGQPALRMAETIARSKNLQLKGICAYAGHLAHLVGFEERRAASRKAMQQALDTRDLLRRSGHAIEIVSGGSTGTYNIDPELEGVTEIQAGSYVMLDVEYRGIGSRYGTVYDDFFPALFVLTTVIHRSNRKAVVDAGLKAFSTDRPFGPEPFGFTGVMYEFAGDEHGRLILQNPSRSIELGDKLLFIPPHCDPTVNLYDRIYCLRGEHVEDEWTIMRRRGPYY
jgi:D-serine deaminase-like pyridoxal phosphate-dependent protein